MKYKLVMNNGGEVWMRGFPNKRAAEASIWKINFDLHGAKFSEVFPERAYEYGIIECNYVDRECKHKVDRTVCNLCRLGK